MYPNERKQAWYKLKHGDFKGKGCKIFGPWNADAYLQYVP